MNPPCDNCAGLGCIDSNIANRVVPCPLCKGTGTISEDRRAEIAVEQEADELAAEQAMDAYGDRPGPGAAYEEMDGWR